MCAMVVEVGPEIKQLVLEIWSCPEERLIQILASNGAVLLRFPLCGAEARAGHRAQCPSSSPHHKLLPSPLPSGWLFNPKLWRSDVLHLRPPSRQASPERLH